MVKYYLKINHTTWEYTLVYSCFEQSLSELKVFKCGNIFQLSRNVLKALNRVFGAEFELINVPI